MRFTTRSTGKWVWITLIATGGMMPEVQADTLADVLAAGHAEVDLRYRLETVSQDNSLKDARASTARLRAGYESGSYDGFFGMAEAQSLGVVGQDFYNSTSNGKVNYATVADPGITEPDQLYIGYNGLPDTLVKYGQQRLQLDNERFIGNVGWRQIEQTFDAATLVNHSLPDTTITTAYLYKIHRVFGDYVTAPPGKFSSRSPLLNINYHPAQEFNLSAYSYLIDLQGLAASLQPAYHSTRTDGIRLTGRVPAMAPWNINYTAEFALQSNGLENPENFLVHYHMAELGASWHTLNFKLSQELLGSNGSTAFQTPLATLHAFSGWADMFLQTPLLGLKDSFATLGSDVDGIQASIIYHDFHSDRSDIHYGTEWDAQLLKHFGNRYTLGAALGAYHNVTLIAGTTYAPATPSTTKGWVWGEISL